jgi:hypothetical protein
LNWKDEYKKKRISIEEGLRNVRSGTKIVTSMAAMEARGLLENLHRVDGVENVAVATCLNIGEYPFFVNREYEGRFLNESWFTRRVLGRQLATD